MTTIDTDTTWIISRRVIKPDHIDTAIVMKDHVIKADTMISEAPYKKVECNKEPFSFFNIVDGEIVKYHVDAAGDTFIVDNLLPVKSVNFEQPQKVEIPDLMIQPSTSSYLQPGDTRSASEIIGVIPKKDYTEIKYDNGELQYDPIAKGILLSFMLYTTSIYIMRSAPYWIEMVSQMKKVFSQPA
jgi:hypothetical protein